LDPIGKGEGGKSQQLGEVGFRGVVGEGVLAGREERKRRLRRTREMEHRRTEKRKKEACSLIRAKTVIK
jgi:hypothetical protein